MKKIIAFGGSNSKNSINKQFSHYTADLLQSADIMKLDLNDFVIPIYGIDLEKEKGIPEDAIRLTKLIKKADGAIISLAEHNGAYTAAFKSIFDWISRIDPNAFETTPVLLLSTSPGGRAGASVMSIALDRFPRHGASIPAHFSLPSFYDNFKEGELVNEELKTELLEKVNLFEEAI